MSQPSQSLDHRQTLPDPTATETEDVRAVLSRLLNEAISAISAANATSVRHIDNDTIDITKIAFDILTQNPHLRNRVMNDSTLTGLSLDDIEFNDRFYLKVNKKVWLFSLRELNDLINFQDANTPVLNPYTLESLDDEVIESVKRRIKANTSDQRQLEAVDLNSLGYESCPDSQSDDFESIGDASKVVDMDVIDQSIVLDSLNGIDMTRSDSFNVPHKITEFLHRVSHLGCYPDVNAFKQLKWNQIISFVKKLLEDWPDLVRLFGENSVEIRKLREIFDREIIEEDILREDQKVIVKFLIKLVNLQDNNDSTRALLFTTELSTFLDQLESNDTYLGQSTSSHHHEALEDLAASMEITPSVEPVETYERILQRLRAQPDNEAFMQQVRLIIQHIVEMQTYSLSNSVTSVSSDNSNMD